jgi:hypothetical protein
MGSIVANKAMIATLSRVKGLTEIRNSKGDVIGFFAPRSLQHARKYAELFTRFDPAEIERRKRLGRKGFTTKEVFQKLQSLTKNRSMKNHLQELSERLEERDRCDLP